MRAKKTDGGGTAWPQASTTTMASAAPAGTSFPSPAAGSAAAFHLSPLPYNLEALEPFISARTMSFHYGKHHQAYVDNLNKLTPGTLLTGQSLEKIIRDTADMAGKTSLYNNAAQVWNHSFFWHSMKGGGGGRPTGQLLEMIEKSFSGFETFKSLFIETGMAQFGSGWVWLIQDGTQLKIIKTSNADTPLAQAQTALLTCDVWEHAYYLDYQNRRKDYLQMFMDHLTNWDFAASQMKG